MRVLQLAAVAALVAAASLPASAQQSTTQSNPSAAAKTAAVVCKGKDEASCQAPDCKWVAPSGKKKGYCRTAPKPKKSAKAAAPKPQ